MAPPKRGLKRRNDEDRPGKPNKRQGKNKRDQMYDTYDDALDGGVEQEEKGERYRDGEKAQRFYERAVELYAKAVDFEETYDAVYNQARALYALAAYFLLPPSSLPLFRQSITLYQKATELTNSPLLRMDVAFNLSQTFSTLADILEDLQADDREKDEAVRKLRSDARDTLAEVMDGQEIYIRAVAAQKQENGGGEAIESVEAGAEGNGMDVDDSRQDDSEDGTLGSFETHLPTPSAYIDTVVALLDLHLSLWESASPSQLPTEEEQHAVRVILDRAEPIAPSGRQAELDLAEIKILLALDRIFWDMHKGEVKVGTGAENSLNGAVAALSAVLCSLDIVPPQDSAVRLEILTTLADTHMTIASRSMFLIPQLPPGTSFLAENAWYHLTQATTHLSTALDLPTDAHTPREFKPSVLLALSKASLARARLAELMPPAKQNVAQLFDNAITYAGRAGEILGWKFVKIGNGQISGGDTLSIGGSSGGSDLPHQAGWSSELLGRTISLQQIRTCLYATRTELLSDEESKKKYQEGLTKVLQKLNGIKDDERKINVNDLERWIEELEDDESQVMELEKGWWQEVSAGL